MRIARRRRIRTVRRGRTSAAASALALLAIPATACGTTTLLRPDCTPEFPDTLVVIAQSVPTAELVPCISVMPPGWTFEDLTVDQDGTTMTFGSDRGGEHALTVDLVPSCRTEGSKRIPSDEAGAQRYELVHAVSPAYSGDRFYTFAGGCVRYRFEIESERASGLLNEASVMLGFRTRDELRTRVAELSGGEITDAP